MTNFVKGDRSISQPSSQYDAIIIGAGHNGLTCGCYLAMAGIIVLVLEEYHAIWR